MTWIRLDIKVAKDEDNEAEGWLPDASAVAAEIRERMEGVDLDTGWRIVKVSPT